MEPFSAVRVCCLPKAGRCQLINLPEISKFSRANFKPILRKEIYVTFRTLPAVSYKSNPFQDQSQDSEITDAFSIFFDRISRKVLLFSRLISDPSRLLGKL